MKPFSTLYVGRVKVYLGKARGVCRRHLPTRRDIARFLFPLLSPARLLIIYAPVICCSLIYSPVHFD